MVMCKHLYIAILLFTLIGSQNGTAEYPQEEASATLLTQNNIILHTEAKIVGPAVTK